ncbi:hypothetical protein [Nocardia fluminea]|uniref:hypothetical protein n=1 Tax=Nocardia fluminea TaxID=134984 RepID=UPI003448632E
MEPNRPPVNAVPSPEERRYQEIEPSAWRAAAEQGVTPPRAPGEITDPTALRRNEIPGIDPVARVAAILGRVR